jgi:hypothetical protein
MDCESQIDSQILPREKDKPLMSWQIVKSAIQNCCCTICFVAQHVLAACQMTLIANWKGQARRTMPEANRIVITLIICEVLRRR